MIWKKIWKRPNKKDLQVGNTLVVRDREGAEQGKAKLITRKPSRHKTDNLPICEFENKNDKQKDTMYLYSTERWLVEWLEHSYYRKGDKTCKDILYYLGRYTDYPSYVDVNFLGNKGCPPDSLVIFIEEEGTMTIDGVNYLETAIQSLDRLKKGFPGEIIMRTHNIGQVKERWELNKIKHRIYDFISTDTSFAEGILDYIERNDIEDFIVISGVSQVKGDRIIQCDITQGLMLKT